jgi:hypothetical protein
MPLVWDAVQCHRARDIQPPPHQQLCKRYRGAECVVKEQPEGRGKLNLQLLDNGSGENTKDAYNDICNAPDTPPYTKIPTYSEPPEARGTAHRATATRMLANTHGAGLAMMLTYTIAKWGAIHLRYASVAHP